MDEKEGCTGFRRHVTVGRVGRSEGWKARHNACAMSISTYELAEKYEASIPALKFLANERFTGTDRRCTRSRSDFGRSQFFIGLVEHTSSM